MFVAVVVTSLCSGFLCKAFHGQEQYFPLKTEYSSEEQCVVGASSVARLAGVPHPYRIECKRI